MRDGVATVDAVVSLTGFSLVGGPAYNDSRAAEDLLARLDVPYITAHPLEFQTIEQWERDPRGLLPVEATMMVALPELDGGVCPATFGGRSGDAEGVSRQDMTPHRERAGMLAARVAAWWGCGGRRAAIAGSPWCCSTSRPTPAPRGRRPTSPCLPRCTIR